jgi:hypothetical protein
MVKLYGARKEDFSRSRQSRELAKIAVNLSSDPNPGAQQLLAEKKLRNMEGTH